MPAARHRSQVYSNPSITVLSITEGPDGFLWLAAEDGLYRFDGFHFQKIPGYPFSSARVLAWTSDGSLWVGGRDGLVRYRGTFQILLRDDVHSMAGTARGVILKTDAAILEAGIDGGISTVAHNGTPYLVADSQDAVWMVNGDAVLLDADRLKEVGSHALPFGFTQAARDSGGRLWAAD